MSTTILWHDYETWGVQPNVDFPVQFAAIRTDLELNIIEDEPSINLMCAIPHDYLPHPQACLVTGISPQTSVQKGMSEPSFAKKIYQHMSRKETCVAGYNSIKFDDEVSRNLFFRNFYPVYEREYKHQNSRWDIIDLVRASYALRPEGIEWPYHDDGSPSFKLDQLTVANSIQHKAAHDALSDVHATIEIAKLIKTQQPKLYDYFFKLRSKQQVDTLLSQFQSKMFVYVSGYIPAKQGCCTIIMPICRHPSNHNAVICVDLLSDIDVLVNGSVNDVQESLYRRANPTVSERATNRDAKVRLFSVAINKCPFVSPLNTLTPDNAKRHGIDINTCHHNFQLLSQKQDLAKLCTELFIARAEDSSSPNHTTQNIDEALYTLKFPEAADKQVMDKIRHAAPEQLVVFQGAFEDSNYNALLFRYRGRNFPATLEEHEVQKWQQHLQERFYQDNKKACLSLREFYHQLEVLMNEYANNPDKQNILRSLVRHAKQVSGE